jgi:hypothetical protein
MAMQYGVWRHGATADRLMETQPGFTIEELVEELGRSVSRTGLG